MHLMSFLWQLCCLGSYFAGNSLDTYWGFVILGSCCLYSFLCSSLGLALCFYQCSWGQGCYSSIEGHWTSYTGVHSVPEGERYSIGNVAAEGQKFRRFYSLQTHSGVGLLIEH